MMLRSFAGFVLLLATPAALSAQAPHSLTPAEKQRVHEIVSRMTPEQKLDYIGGTGFATRAVPSVNLPAFEMSDGPYGTRSNAGFPSTTYAAGIGLAASWDRELAARVGAGIGRDARSRGVHYMLGPGVNIYRSPRNGCNFEYFGEDPFLAGNIATGYITGMQEQGVSATVKHYLGNNSEFLRHDSDSEIEERCCILGESAPRPNVQRERCRCGHVALPPCRGECAGCRVCGRSNNRASLRLLREPETTGNCGTRGPDKAGNPTALLRR